MAELNGNIFDLSKITEDDKKQISVYLQDLLPYDEYEKIKDDWRNSDKKLNFWEFVLEKATVSYK